MNRTKQEGERLSADEIAEMIRDKCPDCGGSGFLAGPCGGLSQNIKCANPQCGSRFNVMGPFGVERISSVSPSKPADPPPSPGLFQRIRDRFSRGGIV